MAYIPAKNLTVTINSQVITAQTASADDEIGEVDVTNLKSGGNYEAIGDILKTMVKFTMVMDGAALLVFTLGAQVPASLVWLNGHSFTGTLIVFKNSHKGGARGAYLVDGEGSFTGAVTRA